VEVTEENEEEEEEEDTSGPDYNYLLSMPLWYLTKEKKEELCKQRDAKVGCPAIRSSHRFKHPFTSSKRFVVLLHRRRSSTP